MELAPFSADHPFYEREQRGCQGFKGPLPSAFLDKYFKELACLAPPNVLMQAGAKIRGYYIGASTFLRFSSQSTDTDAVCLLFTCCKKEEVELFNSTSNQ